MRSRSLSLFSAALLICACAAESDGGSVGPSTAPTATESVPAPTELTPDRTAPPPTEPSATETSPSGPSAPTDAPATTVTQTLTLEFEGCERFTMPVIPVARDVAKAYVGGHSPAVSADGQANASVHALQCDDLRTDNTSHGPGYFATVFIAIDEPADPPLLPDDSGFVTKPTDYFAPVLFHTDNDGFQAASVAFGVPMTRTESTTFGPATEGLQSGSASDREFDPPISYRWTVDNSNSVGPTASPSVHTFLGPSLDGEDMVYSGRFFHESGWFGNPATLELEPGSGLTDLLGERHDGTANGTATDIEMLVFREPPVPSGNAFEAFYPIEYAPGLRLRQVSPETCPEQPRPAFVSPAPSSWWELADRGIAVFDLDASRPGSNAFDEEFVGGIARAAAELGIAVRWLRANAAEYCVDPDAIVVAGYSWGAITALSLAYSTGAVEPGDDVVIDELGPPVAAPDAVSTGVPVPPALAEFSAVPNAVVSHAGFALPETIDPGEPPALLVHGRNDEVIPFDLAEQTCAAAVAVGVVCELIPHLNDHGFDGALGTNHGTSMDAAIDFLNRHVLVPAGRAPLS